MKIGVIGANGNLGNKVVRQAVEAGYEVKAFVYGSACTTENIESQEIDLFSMNKADLEGIDVLISCFGGGFKADPLINRQAFEKYIELLSGSQTKLITIAGAGSLYSDKSHQCFEYESPKHPNKLKEISKYIRRGVDILKQCHDFPWVIVCPSRIFDLTGPFTKNYLIGTKEEVIYNDDGNSYVTYEDLAKGMIDCINDETYDNLVITLATKTVK